MAERGIAEADRSQASGLRIQRHQAMQKSIRTPRLQRLSPEFVEQRSPDKLGSWSSHVAYRDSHRLLSFPVVLQSHDGNGIGTEPPASLTPGDSDHTYHVSAFRQ